MPVLESDAHHEVPKRDPLNSAITIFFAVGSSFLGARQ